MERKKHDLVVFGGSRDESLKRLVEESLRAGIGTRWLKSDQRGARVSYDPVDNCLIFNDEVVTADSVFYRMDVFNYLRTRKAYLRSQSQTWYAAFEAWALSASSKLRIFNKHIRLKSINKPYMLARAKELGLAIPRTVVSNQRGKIQDFCKASGAIAKPVTGGGFTQPIEAAFSQTPWRGDLSPQPAIVQQKLVYPEYRIYRIGSSFVTLAVDSPELDYRSSPRYRLEFLPDGIADAGIYDRLGKLADEVGIEFGAADLKSDSSSGEILFLELNSMPMFAAYDKAADGELNRTILKELCTTG